MQTEADMNKHIDARTLSEHLDEYLDEAAHGTTQLLVSRDGKADVVLTLAPSDAALPPPPDWLQALRDNAKARGLDRMTTEEIDAEIDAARRDMAARES